MTKKKHDIECTGCGELYTITYKGKQAISFCPLCGEEINVDDEKAPLLNDFDQMDEFDEDKYYKEDEEEDE